LPVDVSVEIMLDTVSAFWIIDTILYNTVDTVYCELRWNIQQVLEYVRYYARCMEFWIIDIVQYILNIRLDIGYATLATLHADYAL
jgi:hypothetical protein